MPDPLIEFIDEQAEAEPDSWDPDLEGPFDPDESPPGALGVTAVHLNEDGGAEVHEETFFADEDEEEADEYGLMPDDLQRHLDAQTCLTDWAVRGSAQDDTSDDGDDITRELELMDAVIENGEGEPLANIFKGVLKLRRPDSLDEEQAEKELKAALARMATFGMALHICEHFTALDAYRLLVEVYCREEVFHPELLGTRWVQHYDTAESCEKCQAEFEREYEEDRRRRGEPPEEPL
jgi:hypothetical protein